MITRNSFYGRVNVLGAPDSACTTDDERGYCRAIEDCLEIAEDADAVIAELCETIRDVLTGAYNLRKWAEEAETLLRRLKEREIIAS